MRPTATRRPAALLLGLLTLLLMAFCVASMVAGAEEAPRRVRIGWFSYPGYQETLSTGERLGYNYDYLMRIAEETGWEYEFVDATWDECLSMLEAGELDLMGSVFWNEERASKFAFPNFPCGIAYTALCVGKGSGIGENDFASFDGMRIAGLEQTQNWHNLLDFSQQKGFSFAALPCRTISEAIDAVFAAKADGVIIGGVPEQEGLRTVARFAPSSFYFVANKGNASLLSELNLALEAITIANPHFDILLAERYIQQEDAMFGFTAAEQQYLDSTPALRVLCSGAWAPLERLDEATGEFSGMVAGIFAEISRITGLQFEFIRADTLSETEQGLARREAELVSSFEGNRIEAAELGLQLSSVYLSLPMMMVSNPNADPAIARLTAAVSQTDASFQTLLENYELRLYPTDADCLRALEREEVGRAVVNAYLANAGLPQGRSARWQLSPLQGLDLKLQIGVSKDQSPVLLSILNKAIGQIGEAQINSIILSSTLGKEENPLIAAINRLPVYVVLIFSAFLLLIILVLARVIVTRARGERTIKALLYDDSLTGLYNQRGFDRAARHVLDTAPKNRCYVICHLDINSFGVYNSLYGFEAGDRLLRMIARALSADKDEGQPCARFSSDNFVKLAQAKDLDEMIARTRALNDKISEGLKGQSVLISYGLYEVSDRSLSIGTMCDRASTAKRTAKGNYERFIGVYDDAMLQRQLEDIRLVSSMEQAMQDGEFVPYYQPKYDIRTGQIAGAEALVRWIRSSGEVIAPDRFIGLFEKNGLVARIDRYLFRKVCEQLAGLQKQGVKLVPVSVNFSRVHLFDQDFAHKLRQICRECRVETSLLEVELTESAFIVPNEVLSHAIDDLHQAGFLVSMDDFGSGFSSLNMLKDMHFDIIKLDRGFLVETSETARGQKVIESVLFLARRLRLKTVAEGVETAEQLALLRAHGCDLAQGYYFSRPVPAQAFLALLEKRPEFSPDERSGQIKACGIGFSGGEEVGILEMRELFGAVSSLYSLVISVNLTQNTYCVLEYEFALTHALKSEGTFDELIQAETSVVHPDDRQSFLEAFSREKLLRAHADGVGRVHLVVRWRTAQGSYATKEIWTVFVPDPSDRDVMQMTFCRILKPRETSLEIEEEEIH